jgi:hypothetical protein
MADTLTTDNIKTISALTSGTPAADDALLYRDVVNSANKKVVLGAGGASLFGLAALGSNVSTILTADAQSNMVTALANSLNWGRTANSADITALTTDVITALPHVGDYAVFASTATNVPDANAYYISCIGGGYSASGARYLAFRTGGYAYFGYIATAGTVTWVPLVLGTTNVSTNATAIASLQTAIATLYNLPVVRLVSSASQTISSATEAPIVITEKTVITGSSEDIILSATSPYHITVKTAGVYQIMGSAKVIMSAAGPVKVIMYKNDVVRDFANAYIPSTSSYAYGVCFVFKELLSITDTIHFSILADYAGSIPSGNILINFSRCF